MGWFPPSPPAFAGYDSCKADHAIFFSQNTFHLPFGSATDLETWSRDAFKAEHRALIKSVCLTLSLQDLTLGMLKEMEKKWLFDIEVRNKAEERRMLADVAYALCWRYWREGDTVRRTTFFKAVDSRDSKPLQLVYKEENISPRTGEYWLKQRRETLEIAYRRIGAFRTDRPFKIPNQKLDQILNPKNEVRNQYYKHQIKIFQLGCSVKYLQTSLQLRRRNTKLYSRAKVK